MMICNVNRDNLESELGIDRGDINTSEWCLTELQVL